MSHSLTTPLVKVVGDDALLTCVVQNQQNYTLMWKRDSKEKIGTKILTANTERVTGDPRVSIIHEDGGQVNVIINWTQEIMAGRKRKVMIFRRSSVISRIFH